MKAVDAPLRAILLLLLMTSCTGAANAAPIDASTQSLADLERHVPRGAQAFAAVSIDGLSQAAANVERHAAELALRRSDRPREVLATVRQLLAAKAHVDNLLDGAWEARRQFVALPAGDDRQRALIGYLRTMSRLIDLSGRLRYIHVDGLGQAAAQLADNAGSRDELLDLLIAEKSSAGALVLGRRLLPVQQETALPRLPAQTIERLLELIAVSGQTSLLPNLVHYLDKGRPTPELALAVAETIRRVGLPQDPRPDPLEKLPQPAITAPRLTELLSAIDASSLPSGLAERLQELLAWLERRARQGLEESGFPISGFEVRAGDWLLMRNPSPYNNFTDLSPGLFTHVGVATIEVGPDGIRRMVIVDIPESGGRMPAVNVETYVERTLHFAFVRHPDPGIANRLAEAARDVIGNETLFDLNFRTDRILALKGRPLADIKVHTYCAGLLLLCALQTDAGREEFFPIPERPAGGKTLENLALLGMSIDDDFISPTGAIFSPRLEVVGRREPMYEPGREIEEAIFDHFARLLKERKLVPTPDLFQSLRQRLAEASRNNPGLAQALAKAARVDEELDLVSAAKAKAVVETLDEIAFGASADFHLARDVLRAGPPDAQAAQELTAEELAEEKRIHRQHADLSARLQQGRVSPRQLRLELVEYYRRAGQQELERRFFSPPPKSGSKRKENARP